MSLFRRVLGLEEPAGAQRGPGAPAATAQETESVRRISAALASLPPERAVFVAAFAYLLARAANADLEITQAEATEIARLVAEVGGLDPSTAVVVADMARTRVDGYGATEDYLVSRQFKAISTMEERERLLRCCLLVMAVDDEVVAEEAWLVNRLAEELDVERPDLNRIRAEFHERLSGVRAVRNLQQG